MKTTRSNRYCIVCLDDDRDMYHLISRMVEIFLPQSTFHFFDKPMECKEFIKENHKIVTLLLVDMNLITITGIEFLSEVTEECDMSHTYKVLVSAFYDEDKISQVDESVADEYLDKPSTMGDWGQTLTRMVRGDGPNV